MAHYRRELSVAAAILLLAAVLAVVAPGYFARDNLSDLFLANVPVLVAALGVTLVVLSGQIDISVGSVFAICGVMAGIFAKAGLPIWRCVTGCGGRRRARGCRTCREVFSGWGLRRAPIPSSSRR
jgi:ribose/xylose/arabinose/galactoside ABC-type transport system permease subunit